MNTKLILALDLGTTGNRAIAFSKQGEVVASSYYEFPQYFPKPAWVEHDPEQIWQTAFQALTDVVNQVGADRIVAIGITNQRETTVVWDRRTGKPVYNALVWQCRRTAEFCEKHKDKEAMIREKTGLFLDPYFSATKVRWILDNVPEVRNEAEAGRLLFGTVDSWILYRLTGQHRTEASNASRTLLYNIHRGEWDASLLEFFAVPHSMLPEVQDSGSHFGVIRKAMFGHEIPVTGILGDQQSALFAQGGWEPGVVKNTYGTGLFLVTHTGLRIPECGHLINTVAWKLNNQLHYAIEGSVFVGGSGIQWLRDGLKIIHNSHETEAMALSIESNDGVYFVPALAGLGAPYWDPNARGIFCGLTRQTGQAHIVRAALEAMAYQTRDVIEEMNKSQEYGVKALRVDGGACRNDFLMQFQSDLLNVPVERPKVIETTAFGAAGVAGMTIGFWDQSEFLSARKIDRVFEPHMSVDEREALYGKWKEAVKRALAWA